MKCQNYLWEVLGIPQGGRERYIIRVARGYRLGEVLGMWDGEPPKGIGHEHRCKPVSGRDAELAADGY